MFFIFKKNRILYEQISEYIDFIGRVGENFEKLVKHYLKNGIDAKFEVQMEITEKEEAKADDLLALIKINLLKNSLLPESREDILILLDRVDDIIDAMNHSGQFIFSHNLKAPAFIRDDLKELVKLSIKSTEVVRELIRNLFTKQKEIFDDTEKINNFESVCDSLQLKMIKSIFDSKIDGCGRILLRDLTREIGSITDLCENVGDIITILNIKRAV